MTVQIDITGTEEVARMLERAKEEATQAVEQAIEQAAFHVEGEVKASIAGQRAENASVDTGAFLQSVHTEANGFEAVVLSDVDYGQFLEYGTSKIAERRHFRNTASREQPRIRDFIAKEVKGVLR